MIFYNQCRLIVLNSNVYIIIPVFNEQETIRMVIESMLPYNFTIVVVDDGSTDRSAEMLSTLPVYYLRHKLNLGQGAALQTGISFALLKGAEYLVTFDADGQHRIDDVERLLVPLKNKEADIIFGSRFLKGASANISLSRRIAVKTARWINFIFTGLLLSDAHNGLRAMNKKAAHSINIIEPGMAHASEFLFQVKKMKLKFRELPVNIIYSEYSKKKGQSASNGFNIFIDLLLNKFFQ